MKVVAGVGFGLFLIWFMGPKVEAYLAQFEAEKLFARKDKESE